MTRSSPLAEISQNPFVYGRPLGRWDLFFGRGAEISWINRSVWKKRERQPLTLIGARGSGKTSLINQLIFYPDSRRLITVIINTPQVFDVNLREFLWSFSQSISLTLSSNARTAPPFHKRMLVLNPLHEFMKKFWFPLADSLEDVRLLLAFDNADILYGTANGKNRKDEILDIILELYEEVDNIEYLMVSSDVVSQRASVADQMIAESAVLELSNFDLDDSLDIINLAYPYRIVDSVGTYIHDLTGGHPNDLQRFCHALYERCFNMGITHITFADIAAALTIDLGPGDFHLPVFKRRKIYTYHTPGG